MSYANLLNSPRLAALAAANPAIAELETRINALHDKIGTTADRAERRAIRAERDQLNDVLDVERKRALAAM